MACQTGQVISPAWTLNDIRHTFHGTNRANLHCILHYPWASQDATQTSTTRHRALSGDGLPLGAMHRRQSQAALTCIRSTEEESRGAEGRGKKRGKGGFRHLVIGVENVAAEHDNATNTSDTKGSAEGRVHTSNHSASIGASFAPREALRRAANSHGSKLDPCAWRSVGDRL